MDDEYFLKKLEEGNDLSDKDMKLIEDIEGPAPMKKFSGVNTCPVCDAYISSEHMTTCPKCKNPLEGW